jgi:dipeptidyl aminopeptidase/acylaminoacyl peptidase
MAIRGLLCGLAVTLLGALLVVVVPAAQSRADETEIPAASIASERSCFEGNFATLPDYLQSLRNDRQIPEAQARYQYWTSQFDCRLFTYEVDGLEVHGFYSKPKTDPGRRLPVVIYNHGGNADNGWVRPQFIFGKMFPVAIRGFVVIGSQYRGSSQPGKPNPDRLKDEFGGKDVRDVLALVSIAEKLPFADSSRIGLWGDSRGAMMSFLAARRSSRFSAIAVTGSPTDLVQGARVRPEMNKVFQTWIPEFSRDPDRALRERSVIHWADTLPASLPILILHGARDERVHVESALHFALRLSELERPYQLVIFENGSHALRENEQEASAMIQDWFLEKLSAGDGAKK